MPEQEILFFYLLGGAGLLILIIEFVELLAIVNYQPTLEKSSHVVRLSVIVAARNEYHNLQELVPAILQQEYQHFELIIVLDRCSDKSLEYMKSLEKQDRRIRTLLVDYLPDHFSPKKFALTLGIKSAKNEWCVFTDADCRPSSKQWLSGMATLADEDTDFILGAAPYYRSSGPLNSFIQYETFRTARTYLASSILKIPYMGVGRNLAHRKSQFLSERGYGEYQHIMGGDDDLYVHYHAKGSKTKNLMGEQYLLYSKGKHSWKDYWRQKLRHYSVSKHYRVSSKLKHTLKALLSVMLWISFVNLAFRGDKLWAVTGIIAGFFLVRGAMDYFSARKLGFGYNFFLLPLLELFHTVFVPMAVTVSNARNKVKWK